MLTFLTRRLGDGLLTLAALVTLTLFVMRLASGGAFSSNRKISSAIMENVQAAYHLDAPLVQQFLRYVRGLCGSISAPRSGFAITAWPISCWRACPIR